MVRYLLNHRIAVIMAFLALVILGSVTYHTLPVSLLPEIAIPHITVQVSQDNVSARELENTVVTPLRRQLMQVGGLNQIRSETRDGSAVIALTMDYGVNTDRAFIEVNEKIDGTMNILPRTVNRPKAVKASATDIPVIYLQLTTKSDDPGAFNELSSIADNTVRRRLEQLPEIAMVDITGAPGQILRITPKLDRMAEAAVTIEELESLLASNNVEPGSTTVREGYYEYNIHVTNLLRSVEDVQQIRFLKGNRLLTFGDFANVQLTSRTPSGYSLHNGKRAITLAIIKHSASSMDAMNQALQSTIEYFSERYPDIRFSLTRSQTELLDYTISSLEQNLILSLIIVFLVCAVFLKRIRLSLIIVLSILVGVILTFLLFYLFHVSINIISMSGLILVVGMMIDNSIIVTENITQYRQGGDTLMQSCVSGTNEIITPMLSSSLTTIAVFLPLVFLSGIAGAIFSDQAFSITAGLTASYIVGITLLPVLYYIIYKKKGKTSVKIEYSDKAASYLIWYDKIMNTCFRLKWQLIVITLLMIPACFILFKLIPQQRMPEIESNETLVRIDWNENISLDENRRRTSMLTDSSAIMSSAYIGPQDYLLSIDNAMSSAESELYFLTSDPSEVAPLKNRIAERIAKNYPSAKVDFTKAENIFEKIFSTNESNIEARIHSLLRNNASEADNITELRKRLQSATGIDISPIPMRTQIDIAIDRDLLALYNVDYSEVQRTLRTAFKGKPVSTLQSFQEYTPIEISGGDQKLEDVINHTFVKSHVDKQGLKSDIPLRSLVKTSQSQDLKTIIASGAGEYVPMEFNAEGGEIETMRKISETVRESGIYDVDFAGSFFSNAKMIQELIVILIVSILLMYFILCAQFESFTQPLIVLLEIPVDTAFALISLMLLGQTLNLMSAIGIIVSCGIVVNDSILKLDAINGLRKGGKPLLEAIHTAGRRRLRPIIMTSLTTILAMVPVLFSSDMGSELQHPLAIALIGSMICGTLVSLFIIPLFYWLIYGKNDKNHSQE